MIERTNDQPKGRSKVVGVFPNEESVLGLKVSILIDINEDWRQQIFSNGEIIKREKRFTEDILLQMGTPSILSKMIYDARK